MAEAALIVVHSFGSRPEADIAVSALDAAGIDAIIQADTGGGMRPHLAWAGVGFRVLVREDDVSAARDILDLPARSS
ncbi:MAG: putative signal transducing protein [Vicinamibacterales bacterium]